MFQHSQIFIGSANMYSLQGVKIKPSQLYKLYCVNLTIQIGQNVFTQCRFKVWGLAYLAMPNYDIKLSSHYEHIHCLK